MRNPRALLTTLRLWRCRARGRRELLALAPRIRRDVGISFEDAAVEARKPCWQP